VNSLLNEIKGSMEAITLTGRMSRVVHLNRNERVLQDIKSRLDNAYHDFLVCYSLHHRHGSAFIYHPGCLGSQTRIPADTTHDPADAIRDPADALGDAAGSNSL
jgi:hypothetical protein